MHYRELGKTGVHVSEVGLGCNRIGDKAQPDEFWMKLIQQALDLGVTVFDTATNYTGSRSEVILGQAIGNRDDVCIATKMSRSGYADGEGYSAKRMILSLEGSLKRLQRDRVDIFQLHSPKREEMEAYPDWAEGMSQLKAQGKIRLRAVAVRTVDDALWLIEQNLVDVLQITYNIFETEASQLFSVAEEAGVGLLCRMPLARGVLTGKFRLDQQNLGQHRASLDGDTAFNRIKLVEDLRPLGDGYEGGLTRLAHHYSLTPSAISAIIPGARTLDQLTENVNASNGQGLSDSVHNQIMNIQTNWLM
ncbi:MAG: aldo/keto reductase [Chloroflexota bacterium]